MIDTPHVFDEIHVVSDLHLGGSQGFQIFRETKALQSYVRRLCVPGTRRCLVINGDFVDFLAEAPSRHFDPQGALPKLERLMADKAFSPVFAALAEFLGQPDHRLAIVDGNHDVELALPWVRERLLHELSGGVAERRARCIVALDGVGLLMRVGGPQGPRVLCVHGNEVDPWNVVEHEVVRRMARDAQRGERIDEDWRPNAGSRMVVEVMNGLKSSFPFVDLLKPEKEAVLPILFALKPSALSRINAIAAAFARRSFDDARLRVGWLGDEARESGHQAASSLGTPRGAEPRLRISTARNTRAAMEQMASGLLDRAESRLADDEAPIDLIDADTRQDYLGLLGASWNLIRDQGVEALREALEKLDQDRSFDYFHRDDTFRALHAKVSTDIDFLVAGHTHLARALDRETNRAYYFNSGTWARVFRLGAGVRDSPTRFDALYQSLKTPSIDALDQVTELEPVRPHVVQIRSTSDGVSGELRTVGGQPPYADTLVAHTRFTRT